MHGLALAAVVVGRAGDAAPALAPMFDGLADCDVACDPLTMADYEPVAPVADDAFAEPFDADLGDRD